MIPYEELCAALDRYAAAKRGGNVDPDPATSLQISMPAVAAAPEEDLTYVGDPAQLGATPGAQGAADDGSEIELGDVLADEESI